MPQQDADASEPEEAEEVPGVSLPADDEAPEAFKPAEQALDLPAALVEAARATVLGLPADVPDRRGGIHVAARVPVSEHTSQRLRESR